MGKESFWSNLSQKYTNNHYLNTPQTRTKLKCLQSTALVAENEVKMLQEKIASSVNQKGIVVDSPLHTLLQDTILMKGCSDIVYKKFAVGTFRRLFWEHQL